MKRKCRIDLENLKKYIILVHVSFQLLDTLIKIVNIFLNKLIINVDYNLQKFVTKKGVSTNVARTIVFVLENTKK